MSESQTTMANPELMARPALVEMLRQVRALDSFGMYDNKSGEEILDPYVLTKERKREIPIIGDPDEQTVSRVKAYYNAIAALIEKNTELMAVPLVSLTHEGFGRALVTVGKLVVVDRTLRDVHRFGFPTLEKLGDDLDKVVAKAADLVETNKAVATL